MICKLIILDLEFLKNNKYIFSYTGNQGACINEIDTEIESKSTNLIQVKAQIIH